MYKKEDITKKLEKHMRQSKVLQELAVAVCEMLNLAEQEAEETACQIRPSTATVLLDKWEKEFGLKPRPGQKISFRQETLLAKEKGIGVINKTTIKETAESFSGSEVEVYASAKDSLITIRFTGTVGVPANMEGLKEAIDDIIPAHMEAVYEYTFNTWQKIKQMTWGALKSMTWQQVKEGDET